MINVPPQVLARADACRVALEHLDRDVARQVLGGKVVFAGHGEGECEAEGGGCVR